ncbi:nucleotidyltransferase domain-containing protein [Bradyrhizobium japonicum]|uniref:nucleotidyltransferase domain-containing protein n=1 Tax=Bradyrhizobium japonicum TaxID=375 RepID=UPI000406DB78|nr:nucleotidyltransferase domain-containing protein [Bradyrhizobium japonicum]
MQFASFPELRSLIAKTVGLREPLRRALLPHSDRVAAAFVFGSVAKASDTATSDVDVMAVGDDLDYALLYEVFQAAETDLGRSVNPIFMTPEEWKRKKARPDSFVDRISGQPKIFLIGNEEELHG